MRSQGRWVGARCRLLLALVAGVWAGGCVAPLQGPMTNPCWVGEGGPAEYDLGPLVSCDRSPDGQERFRGLGPLLEYGRSEEPPGTFRALRPFYSQVRSEGFRRREYLWPVGSTLRRGNASSWRVLSAFGSSDDVTDPGTRYRGAVFPLLFWGRDLGGHDYAAFFPLGGELREFLGRDRIRFVLFPLYSSDVKDDMRSYNVLWPFISWGRSADVTRLRLFPFYGRNAKRGGLTRRFVLWPIWTSVRQDPAQGDGSGFILFPFYGHAQVESRETRWYLPPFFRVSQGPEGRTVHAPWPLVQVRDGEEPKAYLWPLWGTRRVGPVESGFVLWPLGRWERITRGTTVKRRHFLLPFFYHDATHARAGEGVAEASAALERYVKVWPVYSSLREGANRRVRVPDLWPVKRTPPVERNWSALWTLYRSEERAEAGETELFWGLYRSRRDPDGSRYWGLFPLFQRWHWAGAEAGREWSVLGGLIGSWRQAEQNRLRLLYLMNVELGEAPDEGGGG